MSKRRLSRQQSRRIAQHQQQRRDNVDDSQLGAEQPGLVIARYGKQADVESTEGSLIRCHLRANLGDVVTGDRVVWCPQDDTGVIVSVEPGRNRLERPDSYGKLKTVAANIDQVIITLAPEPQPHAGLIDRYLVAAAHLDVEVLILINKCDLLNDITRPHLQALLADYRTLEYRLLEISARSGEGLEQLAEELRNKTSVFTGQSGVGKSSLIQKLLPDEEIRIGKMSDLVAKGRHTTTHSRLYHFPSGGDCIDSPGIREFGLWHFTPQQVLSGFRELQHAAGECRFRDCKHQQEPGCAIRQALSEGRISADRFDSFRRIIETLDEVDVRPSQPR